MAESFYSLFDLNEATKKRGQTPLGDFLFSLVEKNYDKLKDRYGFLRYLNIFNSINSSKASRYNVQIYVDFIHNEGIRYTKDRNKIQIGKPAGFTLQPALKDNETLGAGAIYPNKSITIGKVFHSEKIFGESFEYVLDYRWNRLLTDPYSVTCTENGKFDYSPSLSKVFTSIKNVFSQITRGEEKLDSQTLIFRKNYDLVREIDVEDPWREYDKRFRLWLSSLRYCYSNDGNTDNGTTHFFFFNGPIYYGEEYTESYIPDLVIDGNVGLSIRNEKDKENARNFLHGFRQFITQASFNLLVEYMNERLTETAVRASIAQVMARNMSHNIGSHVFSNLISNDAYTKLTDRNIFKAKAYVSSWDVEREYPRKQVQVIKNYPGNFQFSYFNQYLKSRMDYLSEVTFGVSNLVTTKMMVNDVMKELDRVRILLNYISGVTNFNYRFLLKYNDDDLTEENDIAVAFPSDVLGCQAFYNIIENIIRNTAKHAKNDDNKRITFTITIKDNFAKAADCTEVEGVDELYCVEIDNGVTEDNIDELVNGIIDENSGKVIKHGQNTRLDESVLQGQSLRSHSLGLLEMDASAAFLRQIDLPEIESDDYTVDLDDKFYHVDSKDKKRLNILKAFAIKDDENDTKGRLGYRFFLQKPKEFLLVGNWCVTDEKKKQLLNYGIQFLTDEEFCTAMKSEKAFAHQFLIYQEGVSGEVKKYLEDDNDCRTLLPLRKLSIFIEDKQEIEDFWKGGEKDSVDGKQVLQSLKEWAWDRYFKENVQKELQNNTPIQITTELDKYNGEVNNQVVFLNHGNKKNHSKIVADIREETSEVWVENLLSRTWGKLPKFKVLCQGEDMSPEALVCNYKSNLEQDEADKTQIKQEIFEAYHNKVIVIDERVQKFAMENTEGSGNDEKIKSIDLHESTNVHIPRQPLPKEGESEDVFSLDPTDFSELKKKVVAYVDKHINDDDNKPIILVHYGVLERMCGGNVDDINKILKNWAGKGKAKRVVVTSGRGSHSLSLPESVCFVNLSSVLYAFNENRNKYIINNLLNQSRRKRNE